MSDLQPSVDKIENIIETLKASLDGASDEKKLRLQDAIAKLELAVKKLNRHILWDTDPRSWYNDKKGKS